MEQPQRGMVVMGPQGQLGVVDEVIYEAQGDMARVLVRQPSGDTLMLQPGSYLVEQGTLRLAGWGQQAQAHQSGDADLYRTQRIEQRETAETMQVASGQEVVIPVIREELNVATREVERGGVRVHKRVVEREEVVEQPTFREEVTVERVTLGRPIDREVGPWQEGDTLIIPVLEEMLVVEKRLVVREEIRVTRRRIQETEQARVVLREEQVDIEEIGDQGTVA